MLLSCSWAPLWLEQFPPSVNCPLLPWADWFLSTKGCISSAHCCWLIALVTLTVWVRGTMCCAVVLKMYTLSTLTTNRMEPWGFKIEWSSTTPSYLETKLGYTHEYMHKYIYMISLIVRLYSESSRCSVKATVYSLRILFIDYVWIVRVWSLMQGLQAILILMQHSLVLDEQRKFEFFKTNHKTSRTEALDLCQKRQY